MNASMPSLVAGAALAGVLACVGDVLIPWVLGRMVPGYDGTREVLSKLGMAGSPVRLWINAWWCVFGFLMVTFAWGYFQSFAHGKLHSCAGAATVLLVLFGLGAGPGAGLFPMDIPGNASTLSGSLHHWLSGAGFAALIFVPLLGVWVFASQPTMIFLSIVAQIGGLAAGTFVVMSERTGVDGWLARGGLWQRALLVNYYLYFLAIAVVMLRTRSFA